MSFARGEYEITRLAVLGASSILGEHFAERGGQVDLADARGRLGVAKLDRLSRSMQDFTGLMARAQREGWALVALDCAVDTTTPAGEAMANVLATFAQFERRLIGQRTREALQIKKAQGVKLGRPRQLPAKVRQRISRERAKDRTLAGIAQGLNDDRVPTAHGGRQWYASTVRNVLSQEA